MALRPTHTSIQWVPTALLPGVKWPVREVDNSLPSSAHIRNYCNYLHSLRAQENVNHIFFSFPENFPFSVPHEILYAFLISPKRATCQIPWLYGINVWWIWPFTSLTIFSVFLVLHPCWIQTFTYTICFSIKFHIHTMKQNSAKDFSNKINVLQIYL